MIVKYNFRALLEQLDKCCLNCEHLREFYNDFAYVHKCAMIGDIAVDIMISSNPELNVCDAFEER